MVSKGQDMALLSTELHHILPPVSTLVSVILALGLLQCQCCQGRLGMKRLVEGLYLPGTIPCPTLNLLGSSSPTD
jgi:hypothetical protein